MTKVQIRRLDDYNLPPLQEAVDEFLNQESLTIYIYLLLFACHLLHLLALQKLCHSKNNLDMEDWMHS